MKIFLIILVALTNFAARADTCFQINPVVKTISDKFEFDLIALDTSHKRVDADFVTLQVRNPTRNSIFEWRFITDGFVVNKDGKVVKFGPNGANLKPPYLIPYREDFDAMKKGVARREILIADSQDYFLFAGKRYAIDRANTPLCEFQ